MHGHVDNVEQNENNTFYRAVSLALENVSLVIEFISSIFFAANCKTTAAQVIIVE